MKITQLTLTLDEDVTVDITKLHDGICIASEEDLSDSTKELLEKYCEKLFQYDFELDL